MAGRNITYTFDGDTFVGRYRIDEQERGSSLLVEFEQATASTKIGSQPEQQLARALLGRLVREKLAARQQGEASSASPMTHH
jgi:hypothetical protein